MYKRGLSREQASEIAITNRHHQPSPGVTAPIVIPQGPKLRHSWTFDERFQCQLMHYAVVKAVDIEERLATRVGQRRLCAQSIETTTLTPQHKDDEPRQLRRGVRSIEVSLADAVNATVCAMGIVEPFAVKLVVSIACGVTWPKLVRKDPRGRGEKMLGYVRLNALYRMWLASHEWLLPMLLAVEPRLRAEIEGEMRRTKSCGSRSLSQFP